MTRYISNGGVGEKRMLDISCSSKNRQSCWPGSNRFQIVNTKILYDSPHSIEEKEINIDASTTDTTTTSNITNTNTEVTK